MQFLPKWTKDVYTLQRSVWNAVLGNDHCYSENHKRTINKPYGQNAEELNVKLGETKSYKSSVSLSSTSSTIKK
jgi:hypothetical protein